MATYDLDATAARRRALASSPPKRTVTPTTPKLEPKLPPPPKVYFFGGRSYTSYSAYQAAVQGAARADAAKRAAAAAAKELDRRRVAQAAKVKAYQQAARAAALRQSEVLRLNAERRRRVAREVVTQQAAAQARLLERRRLMSVGPRRPVGPSARSLDVERAQIDRRLATRRRQAYDNLQARARGFLRANSRTHLIDDPSRRATASPGQGIGIAGERKARLRRQELVRQGEQTGNWAPALDELLKQSRLSGGRYVDNQLLAAVQNEYVKPIQQLRDEFAELMADLRSAEAAGDEEALLDLVEDPESIALYERFTELFGDGVKPGSFTGSQAILEEISYNRQRAWLGPMEQSARTEVQRLLQKARLGSHAVAPAGRRPSGARLIDERVGPLEYMAEVLDPETGGTKMVRKTGIDAWLAKAQVAERERVLEDLRQSASSNRQLGRLLESEDMELEQVAGGRIRFRDRAVERQAGQIREWMPGWRLNADGVPTRIAAAAGNPGVQEQLIREFMADAERAYDENMDQLRRNLRDAAEVRARAMASGTRTRWQVTASALFSQSWDRAKNAWLEALALRLGKPQWGGFERFSTTGLGGLAQGALTAFSAVPAFVRHYAQRDAGAFEPYLDLHLWGDKGFGFDWGKTVDPNAEAQAAAYGQSVGSGDFWTDVGAFASVVREGAMWGTGNLGGLATTFTDPFALVGPERFIRAGSLATARAGGFAGLRAGGKASVRQMVEDFVHFSAPRAWGGAGRSAVKVGLAKAHLARKLGLAADEVLGVSDDEFRQLVDAAAMNRTDELLRSDAIKQWTQASGMDKTQILNMVQAELPAILREFKIFPESPFETAARIRSVREAAESARSQAESAAQLVRMQTERAEAMRILSEETGRVLEAPRFTERQLAEHATLVDRYAHQSQRFLKAAEAGVRAADEIEKLAGADPRRLRTLQAQLKRSSEAIRKFGDTWDVDPLSGKRVMRERGVVSQHFERLRAFRGRIGDPTAPSFVDSSIQEIRQAERQLRNALKRAESELKRAPMGSDVSEIKARVGRIQQALRGLVYERAMKDEGRTLMRPYARRHIDRVRSAVPETRVAPPAIDAEQISHEIGRDFMRRLHDISSIRSISKVSEKNLAALRDVMAQPVDLSVYMRSELAQAMRRALGRNPTFGELWIVLQLAERGAWSGDLARAIKLVRQDMYKSLRASGVRFSGNVRDLNERVWEILRDEHQRLGMEAPGIEGFTKLDLTVRDALRAWRDNIAEGQVRLRERRFKPQTEPRSLVFHDDDPFEVLVKMRVLGEAGSSMFAYDELRGVLQREMLREEAAKGIIQRATRRMAAEGMSLEDAVRLERRETAEREAIRNVEEFSVQPSMQGLPPEARLRAFEERMMLDDMPDTLGIEVSEFQQSALRRSFEERLGFSFDDKHQIARYFRGEFGVLPEGARRPHVGEYDRVLGDAEGIPVNVVPEGHPRLDDQLIPFGAGRAREGLDKDIVEMLRQWDKDLVDVGVVLDDGDDLLLSKPRVRDPELSEAATERRGGLTGGSQQRQNAAQEARRSSRRNFDASGSGERSGRVRKQLKRVYGWHERAVQALGIDWETAKGWAGIPIELQGPLEVNTPRLYRRWLWEQMQSSPEVRQLLVKLRETQIVGTTSGIKAQLIADAIEWMKTKAAQERFAVERPHEARLTGETFQLGADGIVRRVKPKMSRVELLMQEQAVVEEGLRVSRQLAGLQVRAKVHVDWLNEALAEIERIEARVQRDLYYFKTGDVKELAETRDWLRAQITRGNKGDGFVEAPFSDWHRLDKFLEDTDVPSIDNLGQGTGRVDLEALKKGRVQRPGNRSLATRWIKNPNFNDDPTGLWARRVVDLEGRLGDIKAELKEARAGVAPRHRGRVGLSVHGDGVYIAEGTSNVTLAHELFHQFWDDEFNATWRGQIEQGIDLLGPELRTQLWRRIRVGTAAYDPAEFAAELYALWRVGDEVGGEAVWSWGALRSLLTDEQAGFLDNLGQIFGEHSPRVVDTLSAKLRIPPLGNRARLLRWFEQNGYWSRRTGAAIRAGERVWSVAAERKFYKGFMEYEAPWTDEVVLKAILNDPRLHEVMLREWGFFEDEYENAAAASGLTPSELADAVVWGKDGFQRQRTLEELRSWAVQRYGGLVSQDGKTLTAMPWLMRADDEYLNWTSRFFDEALGQASILKAARDKLPADVRRHLFDGDQLSRVGMQIDPKLVKAKEVQKLRDAIVGATRRRLERMKKVGDVEPGDWLAEEQLRFAYDVTDQLLSDPVWRGLLRGTPILGAVLRSWGQFWRLLVSWQVAFPIMNLIETYGLKRLLLTVYEGGMRPLSLEKDGRRLVENLRQIGAESHSVFHMSAGSPWARVGDQYLPMAARGRALTRGLAELPVQISRIGEDALRLDFARRVAGDTFRNARRGGMSVENAEWLARHEAKRLVDSFFAIGRDEGWSRALNELVPFFSYNFKNKTLAIRMLAGHPTLWLWGEKLRQAIEDANREQWAKDHPDLPFPEGPSASWLWWKVGEEYYKIDLSSFSDWSRAMASVSQQQDPAAWFNEFIRIPHPTQLGALSILTGGDTPWGNPGHIREMSIWADLWFWSQGVDLADPRRRRDALQMASQLLFFKKFGKTSVMDIKQMTYFSLRQLDEERARAYLEANPDLQLYWDAVPDREKIRGFDEMTSIHFRQLMSREENEALDAAYDEFNALMDTLDARVAQYAARPWSEEYRQAKLEASIVRQSFLAEHPDLVRSWTTWRSPAEFAEMNERFIVDELADAWFNWKRPSSGDFGSELEYQEAVVAFNERRQAFLEAHPALAARLSEGRTAVETAWKSQELHWTEILDFQARLKVRILEEELQGAAADRDVIDLLYRARDFAGAELDAGAFGVFSRELEGGRVGRFFASLPGFSDLRYQRATPEERKQMDHDNWYVGGIKDIVRRAKSGKEFYDLLRQNPALLQEYWARNPDKKAEFQANQEYIRWIGSWARSLQGQDFDGAQATWDAMPAWVKERYFAKHPDSAMRDGIGGGGVGGSAITDGEGNFFRSADSRDRFLAGQQYFSSISRWVDLLKAREFVKADAYFRSLPDWMKEKYYAKHPDQRAKNELDMAALRYGAEYFLATGDDKLRILAKYPQLRAWLAEHGGDEAAMRGLINAMYRAIPSTEPWLRRTFRERFPEVFSKEAAGERALKRVAGDLAEHPEMLPFYEKAYRLQVGLYMDQLKRSKVPPRPWSMERKRRLRQRTKRRAARLYSHWSLHSELRRQQ